MAIPGLPGKPVSAPFAISRWITASLWHYRRTNVALVLGVIVGTAVIGGALVVGDSVRTSLRQMTLHRLGKIDYVLTGPRFFRVQLVDKLSSRTEVYGDGQRRPPQIAPAIVMVGGVERKTETATRRASHVNIYGVGDRAWQLISTSEVKPPADDGVLLNSSVATELQAHVGDELTIWIELPSAVPRDTLLGKRDDDTKEVTVTVAGILPDGPGAARLGLNPTQQLPLNVFVDLHTLQDALDLAEVKPNKRDPVGAPARINAILSGAWMEFQLEGSGQMDQSEFATDAIRADWQLADLHLRIVHDTTLNVLSLESEQMLLEDQFANAALEYAKQESVPASPVYVYLANWIRNATNPKKYSMYSTVAGLDVLDLDDAFGPWEFVGTMPDTLGEHDVILNEFLAEDLQVQVGDEVRFGYHLVGSHGELPEEERTVTVRGIVKMSGAAADKQLAPEVKGITDVESLAEWDQPFPMNLDDVTARDDDYWALYRATPKMFFPLATARKLWPSRYGTLTSVRVGLKPGQSVEDAKAALERYLLTSIDPRDVGLAFQPVKLQGLRAASGATDFTGLFVGFSFFLILSAVILVGLLFRLTIDQRVQQWGLLSAMGLPPRMIRRMMLGESLVIVCIGCVLGSFAAVGYAQVMLYGLKTWWIGAIGTNFLFLSVSPISVAIGAAIAGVASLVAMIGGLWQLRGVSLRALLSGVSEAPRTGRLHARSAALKAAISLGVAVALLLGVMTSVIPASEAFSGLSWPIVVFFVAGLLLLASGLWALSAWLQRTGSPGIAIPGSLPKYGLLQLGLRNASRRRQRSILSTGLIAAATFVITAVAAGHKDPSIAKPEKYSGNGGFTLVAEASRPILQDLNTPEGRRQLNLQPQTPAQTAALNATSVMSFRVKPGEDASCLNLFQARAPTILGVPEAMISRGGFKIIGGGDETWTKLESTPAPRLPGSSRGAFTDDTVAVLGDMNTLMFGLKKGVGDKLAFPAEDASFKAWLEVAGMFDGSVFQGVLLMSEENFLKLFPERQGYQYFLIEVPPEHATAAAELLETELSEYGLDTEPIAERLARFLAVQNTYLSTFQTLGGLGLLLGTFGLATVMLRNVWERQAEFALLRAVGFVPRQIAALVLTENAWLLMWGLATGAISALVAMTPHLSSTGAEVPWTWVLGLLAAVFVAGCAAAWGAVRTAVRLPIVATLRGE
jgi:putative ABC transport system permease protein